MKLVEEWKWVIRKAWSFRLGGLAAVFSGAEVVVPLFADALPRGTFAILSFASVAGAMAARLVAQRKCTPDA